MWHLEAFAMLGALAWQATTVIKMILVSWGEIARGLFYLSPGFSPPVSGVPCCVPAVTTDPSSWHNVLPSRIRHGASHQTSKVQPLIYSWDLHKHKHIEVESFILNMRYWDRIMFWRRLPRLGRLEYIMSI